MTDMARKRLEKRYAAHVRKRGVCGVCVYRDRDGDRHGRAHCRGDWRRGHPLCVTDGQVPRFRLDVDVVDGFREKSGGVTNGK